MWGQIDDPDSQKSIKQVFTRGNRERPPQSAPFDFILSKHRFTGKCAFTEENIKKIEKNP
jgi:hypothetical protein